MMPTLAQTYLFEQRLRPFARFRQSCDLHRHEAAVVSRQRRNQVERLKDETDFRAPQPRQLSRLHLRDVLAVQANVAGGRVIEPGDKGEQRGFAAARRADDGDELTSWNGQIDCVQDGQLLGATGDSFGYVVEQDHISQIITDTTLQPVCQSGFKNNPLVKKGAGLIRTNIAPLNLPGCGQSNSEI